MNDRFGHAVGDEVLQAVAQQLQVGLRRGDVLARLGGDEFALLLPEAAEEHALTAVSRALDRVRQGMQTRGWQVGVSAGLLTATGPGLDAETLLREADALMYEGKRVGKGSIRRRVLSASIPPG